jgi:alpha-glucosidase (family GH31 glycosyl hydrolase)
MTQPISRRQALEGLAASSVVLMLPSFGRGQVVELPVEIAIASISARTVRITTRPVENGTPRPLAPTGALLTPQPTDAIKRAGTVGDIGRVRAGDLVVRFSEARVGPDEQHTLETRLVVERADGQAVQTLTWRTGSPGITFALPSGPLLGLGEGGAQFDRKGKTDRMRNGQVTSEPDGYRLAIHGTRAPIQWLIGTDAANRNHWGLFIHQPYGSFDFTGAAGTFTPAANNDGALDLFITSAAQPADLLREYARVTGLPEMPPLWAFGYMQSSRTLAGPDEILGVARTFREKKLPCDSLVYLGTEFAPSGWNTRNGEFTWHPTNFPKPKEMMDALHALHFRTVVHVVIEGRQLHGRVSDPCTAEPLPPGRTPDNRWPPSREVSCYWPVHKDIMATGVDGFWPDQGDGFDGPSRLNRHRMYWEGMQMYRPDERPFALHRNASAGVQRFGGFIWSGDVQARWETLATHVPNAINTGLSGLPYWGTDIGGFNPTEEYTAELHVRWFQFAAFCPSFRAHGRNWHLKLPWGWSGGDGGPFEAGAWRANPADLQRPDVETILRKYLELRYRLLPYLATALRETHDTGMPLMRALWLHYPDDPIAVARGDQFLWGRDLLVAPVVEKGATERRVYLPRGSWIDFWTNERVEGGREITRSVDLETMPLYVRAGAVVPLGPVKQYVQERVDAPMTLTIYPGADGASTWYEDDGLSFAYRKGAFMRVGLAWQDAARRLTLRLTDGRMQAPVSRPLTVRVAGAGTARDVTFDGRPLDIRLQLRETG